MRIKAVSFDIGHTLVRYNNPLNWKALYEPALRQVLERCGIAGDAGLKAAEAILLRYNTRENPRETEVDSSTIFREILGVWGQPEEKLDAAKSAFYGFFQAGAVCFEDTEDALRTLRAAGMKLGALTDVAYGMDSAYALRDIAGIRHYFDLTLTSVDVGYRKPHGAGYERLLRAFCVYPAEMLYVGDEEKDIAGANALGIVSALICRNGEPADWGQQFTVRSLAELPALVQ